MTLSTILPGWLPPTREHWQLLVYTFQFFPLVTAAQWLISWYPAGKTSNTSPFNIPGKIAWVVMESPTFLVMTHTMLCTSPHPLRNLPLLNWVMAGMYASHYVYRALLCPLLNPSMSPIHAFVMAAAFSFNVANALSIGGWLAGYGPVSAADWSTSGSLGSLRVGAGMAIWAGGLLGNVHHDEILRTLRRPPQHSSSSSSSHKKPTHKSARIANSETSSSRDKHYAIPEAGLFAYILYPHYLCEWLEWTGFWLVGGPLFVPGRNYIVNEIATMLPRAVQGRRWYVNRFGEDKLRGKKAIIPWVL